ncbi:imidazole glycerol phosphate synthase subunit HisH [Clostridium sp. BJN0001]|uniref:imidazole glycerol phosphate synthase subunit HisH n=1 Tax=Clostridium sp. BJN0001 TaxID=2930219 RepID=UPI001FD51499|nr:imidazole glycerol phosphate synthase subunit HisH [Clostridium sp. BJN0001]
MITIIDYGMGNLKSVQNALKFLNIESKISKKEEDFENCDGLILPGVGAFPDAMDNIEKASIDKYIKKQVSNGKMILGICLGMQLLFEKSYEGIEKNGLALLKGNILKMEDDKENNIKIPHIGWNSLKFKKNDSILKGLDEESYVYYVHSYFASNINEKNLICYSEYGNNRIPGIVRDKNIIGAQFHPEKSGEIGLTILKNFGELIR